jgi:predicted GIY-YIG superfamily endonuclease
MTSGSHDPWQLPERAHSPAEGQPGPGGGDAGTVYLIHLDEPYKHARHYTGWTTNLDARLEAHREGRGARLMEVVKAAGITWRLARTWPGGRERERAIKDRHEAPRLCPQCSPVPRPVSAGRSSGRAHPGRLAGTVPAPRLQHEPAPGAPAASLISDPWRPDRAAEADVGDAGIEAG